MITGFSNLFFQAGRANDPVLMFRDALATEITGAFGALRHRLAGGMVKATLLNKIGDGGLHD